MVFTTGQKVTKHLGYFGSEIVTKKFQKSPNLVTLMVSDNFEFARFKMNQIETQVGTTYTVVLKVDNR